METALLIGLIFALICLGLLLILYLQAQDHIASLKGNKEILEGQLKISRETSADFRKQLTIVQRECEQMRNNHMHLPEGPILPEVDWIEPVHVDVEDSDRSWGEMGLEEEELEF